MSTEVLSIEPGELKFPFELGKQISCSVKLVNNTESHVAFQVTTTSPKKYCVRPHTGVVSRGATREVTVTMQAQMEAPPDMQGNDKLLVQSVLLLKDADHKEMSPDALSGVAWHVALISHHHSRTQQVTAIKGQAGQSKQSLSSVNFYDYLHSNKKSTFFEQLAQAWCEINDEAKRIVDHVVGALSNFVKIDSQKKV